MELGLLSELGVQNSTLRTVVQGPPSRDGDDPVASGRAGDRPTNEAAVLATEPTSQPRFARLFANAQREMRAVTDLGRSIDAGDPQRVRQAAVLLLSQLFFTPLLAEARRSPFISAIGHGGRGEEIFGEQLDQRIADMVASRADGLVEPLMEKLMQRSPRSEPRP